MRATIELRDAELVSGARRTDLGHLKGSRDTAGDAGRAESRTSAERLVPVTGARSSAVVSVVSEKGGTATRELTLRSP